MPRRRMHDVRLSELAFKGVATHKPEAHDTGVTDGVIWLVEVKPDGLGAVVANVCNVFREAGG